MTTTATARWTDGDWSSIDEPSPWRRGSPGDIVRLLLNLVILVVGLLLATVAAGTIGEAEADLVDAFTRLPDGVEHALVGLAQMLVVVAPVPMIGLVVWRREWRLLGMLAIGTAVAAVITVFVERALPTRVVTAAVQEAITEGFLAEAGFPSSGYVAGGTAFVTIMAPWLSRRWKRAAWTVVVLVVLLRILASTDPSLDVVLSAALGAVVGTLVLLGFGSPNAEPRPEELADGLREAGFEPGRIARMRAGAVTPTYRLDQGAGAPLFVKLRTPDDQSADLLNRIYEYARLRSAEIERRYLTLRRRVEHEGLVLSSAERHGVRSPRLEAIGRTSRGSVFLVEQALDGRRLSTVPEEEHDDAVISDLWRQVARLHEARIAHRNLSLDNVIIDAEDQVWIVDYDRAELAAPANHRVRDVANLLVELGLAVGPQRAVTSAIEGVGPGATAAALPLLQPLATPRETRKRMGRGHGLLKDLQHEVEEQTGTAPAELARLERVRPRTLLLLATGAIVLYLLIPQLVSFNQTVDSFRDIDLVWVPAILAASALTYMAATISFLGAVLTPIPVLAAARVTIANSFATLVGPAMTGSLALSVRFLQRAGLNPGEAGAAAALDAGSSVPVHIVMLFGFVAWARTSFGGFSIPDANTILLIAVVVVAVVSLLLAIGPLRRRLLGPIMRTLRDAGHHVANVARSPIRVSALLGGSALLSLFNIAALTFSVEAYGGGLDFAQTGAAYLVAATVANAAPTPGGLGAFEAALVATLTGYGLADGPAVSAALTFRAATFWLPILPGWLVFVWMERHDEL